MKAICTKYLGPTDSRGSRIKAWEPDGKSITLPYDHALNSEDMHARAAIALCRKLDWKGSLASGWLKQGYVFVFVDEAHVPYLHTYSTDKPIGYTVQESA